MVIYMPSEVKLVHYFSSHWLTVYDQTLYTQHNEHCVICGDRYHIHSPQHVWRGVTYGTAVLNVVDNHMDD